MTAQQPKTHLELIRSKIFTLASLQQHILYWRFKSRKIVFTNGCFDILHQGHIDYLSKAADCGHQLIVAINSDASVRLLGKGPRRPIQDEFSRAITIASLAFVSAVILFEDETPYEMIKALGPDVLVKGADYTLEQVAGHDIVLDRGGEVKLIDFLPGYSTSAIEKRIKESW